MQFHLCLSNKGARKPMHFITKRSKTIMRWLHWVCPSRGDAVGGKVMRCVADIILVSFRVCLSVSLFQFVRARCNQSRLGEKWFSHVHAPHLFAYVTYSAHGSGCSALCFLKQSAAFWFDKTWTRASTIALRSAQHVKVSLIEYGCVFGQNIYIECLLGCIFMDYCTFENI